MKKLKLFFACLLMAVLSIGQVWAVDYDLVYTLDGTITASQGNSNYDQTGAGCPQGDITWMVVGNTTQNPWRIGGKSLNGTDRTLTAGSAIAANIAKIEIESGTASNITVNSLKVEVASDAEFTSIVSTITPEFAASSTAVVERPSDKDWTGKYYRITYNLTNTTTTNRFVQFKSAKFFKEKSASDPTLEADPIEVDFGTVEVGASVPSETVEVTFANLTGDVTYSGLTTPFSASGTISSTGDAITISADASAAGTFEQTLTIESADDSKSVEVTVKMKVAAPTGSFELFEGDIEEGDYVIYYNGKALKNTVANSRLGYAEVTPAEDKITNPEEAIIWHIAASGEYWTIYNAAEEKYAAGTSSKNQGALIADGTNDLALWTVTETSGAYDFENKGRAAATSDSDKKWLRNNGTYGFATYASGTGGALTLYKKADGKQNAGLAYAEADQKQLAKLGEAFTAPTLVNPHALTVAYASNNTAVAEVASNGAITINGVGVAVITASFGGDASYRSGSASYTIGVTTHAGTAADPYVAADVKIAIDVKGTVENAYASGVVSNVVTTELPAEGYITFYFSADGLTSGQQVEAYKCYGLNSAPFEAVGDVVTGATVVVTGNLQKFSSTYEFGQNCHLVSYEAPAVPKTHIANDQANPYTVAQAITFAADPVTYDLDDFVYVQGVVDYAESFSSTNGTLNIFIKDANAENQFELYKCAGINDGNETTAFTGLDDVQSTNIVIAYGQLTVYNNMSELKQGNYLVDFQAPVTAVEMDATAEVEVGSTVTLTAHVMPENATDQSLTWSVQSGSDYASVDENGVVTGVAEGEAVIRVASTSDPTKYSVCTVTVTPAVAPGTYDYALVTSASQLQDGLKVIIVAAEADKAAGAAAATYREVVDVERTPNGNYLILDSENMPTEFTLGVLPAAGQYTFNDGDGYMYESAAKSVKVQADPFAWSISIGDGNIATIQATNELRYNSGSPRFTTYASGQQALQLYVKDDGKQAAGLAWSTDAVILTVGDEFNAPALTNPNNLAVTIESNNTELATVENNVVSLVANVTGTAKITASFGGDDTYRAASVSYTITVSAAPQPAGTANVVIIAEYNNKFFALTNSISNKTAIAVEITKDGDNIVVTSEEAKTAIQWTRTTEGENTTFQDAYDKYLKGVSNGGDLTLADDACNWGWNATDEYYFIGSRSFIYRESAGGFKNYSTQNAGSQDYSTIAEVRVIDPENIVVVIPTTHTVSYNANGGTLISGEDPIADAQVAEGATVTVAASVYEKADHSFAGWLYGETLYNAGQTFPMPTTDVELVAQWTPVVVSDYVLVTNVNQLQAGDKVVIVAAELNFAAGAQAGTYRESVEIAKTSDKSHLIFGSSMPTEFTLGISELGGYSFNDGAGYMYEEEVKKVKTQADPYYWSISIDAEGIATISATTDNALKYNSSSPRFTTYASGQQALQLYRKPGAAPAYVDVRTDLIPNHYYTICYPNAMTDIQGATLWSFIGKDAQYAYLVQETASTIEAGKPYIMYATASTVQAVLGDETNAPGANGAIHGTFSNLVQEELDNFATVAGSDLYLVIGDELRRATGYDLDGITPLTGNSLPANRAFVVVGDIPAAPANMPAHVRRMPMQTDQAQGFENIEASEKPMKLMIDGQMYILRGEKVYDATGRLVK